MSINKCLFIVVLSFCIHWVFSKNDPVEGKKGKGGEDQILLAAGMKAPPIMLRNLQGKFVKLSHYVEVKSAKKKKWRKKKTPKHVIAAFWATYCIPCKKEIPMLQELEAEFKEEVKLFLISIDKMDKKLVPLYVREHGITSEVLLDSYRKTADRYGVKSLPTLFLVNRQGDVVYRSKGFDEKEGFKELRRHIEELLLKKAK